MISVFEIEEDAALRWTAFLLKMVGADHQAILCPRDLGWPGESQALRSKAARKAKSVRGYDDWRNQHAHL
jgi:hypothetical protein